ncbi:hypothetical protein ACHHYP_00549 [Achlya hypogyna]|uniref:Transmembrane protein 198 n=1 Tax=Achlya hypogyna TaxID=1202772 RepID=A0A1V9ZU60_ACHHY|nr:hypothetical protein ACHHYP_00549 [Achlya hypogyna]
MPQLLTACATVLLAVLAFAAADTDTTAVNLVLEYVVRTVSMRAPATPSPAPSNPDSRLDLLLNYHHSHIWGGLLAGFAIPAGLVLAFVGYKLLQVSALLCGFAFGGLALYVLALIIFANQTYIVTATWVAFIIGAILIGVLSLLLTQVGNFIIGLSAGSAFAALQHITFAYKYWPSNPNGALYINVASWGVVFAAITVLGGKPLQIVSTSLVGGTMTVWGIGYFSGRYPSVVDLPRKQEFANGPWEYEIPSAWWGYLTATLVLWVAGIGIQFAVTGVDPVVVKKEDHHETHKNGHHELYAHHHLSRYSDSDSASHKSHTKSYTKSHNKSRSRSHSHDEIEMTERHHHRDHRSERMEEGETVTETTYVQVGSPHNQHDHRHERRSHHF